VDLKVPEAAAGTYSVVLLVYYRGGYGIDPPVRFVVR
jgi:hypothetical protein